QGGLWQRAVGGWGGGGRGPGGGARSGQSPSTPPSSPPGGSRGAAEAVADTATRSSTMQEVMGQDAAAGSGSGRNWAELIRARLAGSVPRHDPDHWLMPGRFESQGWRHSLPP